MDLRITDEEWHYGLSEKEARMAAARAKDSAKKSPKAPPTKAPTATKKVGPKKAPKAPKMAKTYEEVCDELPDHMQTEHEPPPRASTKGKGGHGKGVHHQHLNYRGYLKLKHSTFKP